MCLQTSLQRHILCPPGAKLPFDHNIITFTGVEMRKKCSLCPILISIMLSVAVVLPYYFCRLKEKSFDKSEYNLSQNSEFRYELENITRDSQGRNVVVGWLIDTTPFYEFYNYGVDSVGYGTYNNMHIGVIKGEKVIEFPTKLREREDVDLQFDGGKWHGHCGFLSYVPKEYENEKLIITATRYTGEKYIIPLEVSFNEYFYK